MSATVEFRWRGPAVSREVLAAAMRGVDAGAHYLAERVRSNILIQGPPASVPGEYPHMDTGELRDSIRVARGRGYFRRVVATAPHAVAVEEKREFLARTYREERSRVRRVVLEKAKLASGYTVLA